MDEKERARQYAKFYHITHRKPDYLNAIKKNMGDFYLKEASLAWEAIDSHEDEINQR